MKPDCSLCRVERLFGLKWGNGTHGAMEPIEKGQTPDEAAHETGQTPGEAALIERTDAG